MALSNFDAKMNSLKEVNKKLKEKQNVQNLKEQWKNPIIKQFFVDQEIKEIQNYLRLILFFMYIWLKIKLGT